MQWLAERRALFSECLGTAILVATVVGSGIMGDRLAGGNVAIALLGNTVATGAILVVLITILGPVGGAHFNPAVTLAQAFRRRFPWPSVAPYIVAQIVGGCLGTLLAHAMFEWTVFEFGAKARTGAAQWLSEAVATFTLLSVIFGCERHRSDAIPVAVGLTITSAYWFTASTSFANPAVTIARALTKSFAGIAPSDVLPFILAQGVGAALAMLAAVILFKTPEPARNQ